MVGGEWSWSWWVAVVVVRGEGADGVGNSGWWGGRRGVGWLSRVMVVGGCDGGGRA
jgi:hypothetical protein